MAVSRDWSELAASVAAFEDTGGAIGVGVLGPEGETFSHNGARLFRAASTMKIPLMVELCRQMERGEFAIDDPYVLTAEAKAIGSGVLLDLHDGLEITYRDLIYLMISISDNTATNILIDRAGMAQTVATMRDLGMAQSTLGRKMFGRPAQGDEQENWATPDDYVAVVKAILDDRAAAPASCELMRGMLRKQQNPRRFARYIPRGAGIVWGSKTGTIAGACNDVGYVTTERGTLIVAAFCENPPDTHVAERAIGVISRAAMIATGIVEPLAAH